MQVDFYHLSATPIDRVLPRIAERVLADGERLLVVEADEGRRDALDRALWTYAPDSFLPHGLAGVGDEAAQPVLIAPDPAPANAARNVLLAGGRWRDEALAFDRAFLFFDDERVAEARAAWRDLSAREDVVRAFWRQKEAGGWEKVG